MYRFSYLKSLAYLRAKVDRLCDAAVVDSSRTLTRALTKEGLMDDGKEDLLHGTSGLGPQASGAI